MLQSIRLQHFRSYIDDSFEFSPSVNIIVGPNASGKTNLLESILVVADRYASYRVRDISLIEFNQPWSRIDALVDGQRRIVKIVNTPKIEKTYELLGHTFKKLTVDYSLPVVLFEPNNLMLLIGPPENRRQYLDNFLLQTITGYSSTLQSFRRSLSQRNRLLKTPHVNDQQLFPWNVRLSELGGYIANARSRLVESINDEIGILYRELSRSNTTVKMVYKCPVQLDQYESHMLHYLESRINEDIANGFTSFGPHHEDFEVLFNNYPSQEVASRGETRTLVLGLKLFEADTLRNKRNKSPILLFDDVFSELDGIRRQALTTYLQPYQTFISTTDADVVVEHFSNQSNIIPISKNSY